MVLLGVRLKPIHVPLEYKGVGVGIGAGVKIGVERGVGENGREGEAGIVGIVGTIGVGAKHAPTVSPWSK